MYRKPLPRFHCSEMWKGNEKIEKEVQLRGLRGFLLGVPYGSAKGGDIYFLASCDELGLEKIVLADVSGHGDIASWAADEIERLLKENINEIDNGKLLASINYSLNQGQRNGGFVTMVAATYHSEAGQLLYSCAGHPALLRYDAAQKQWQALRCDSRGVPLGITNEANYLLMKSELNRGDMLLFYTDGLLSIKKESGAQLSIAELLALCQEVRFQHSNPRPIIRALINRIKRMSTSGFHDDLTLLLLEIL